MEQKAAETLLQQDKGISFEVKRSFPFHKSKREFVIRQSYLGTLLHLSKLYASLGLNAETLTGEDWLIEAKSSFRHSRTLAKVVAVAWLNSKWKIRLFSGYYTNYFLWKLKPEMMANLARVIVLELNDTVNFLTSIKFLTVERLTKPKSLSPTDSGG